MRNSEQYGSRSFIDSVFDQSLPLKERSGREIAHTLIEFKVCDGLPFVRRNEPLIVFTSTRQVDDELVLVVSKRVQNAFETVHAEY